MNEPDKLIVFRSFGELYWYLNSLDADENYRKYVVKAALADIPGYPSHQNQTPSNRVNPGTKQHPSQPGSGLRFRG